MTKIFIKSLKKIFFLGFFLSLFIACSNHKYLLSGTNDFQSLVSRLVEESADKMKKNLADDDIVLVSDFVNLDRLENRSELGFLLSDLLKDKLVQKNIIVRQVEFAKEFQLGRKGLNLMIRNKNKIVSDLVTKAKYAVVGTYSLTSRSLNVFIKLIDLRSGYIYASSYERTDIDEEILQLESSPLEKRVYKPHVVL